MEFDFRLERVNVLLAFKLDTLESLDYFVRVLHNALNKRLCKNPNFLSNLNFDVIHIRMRHHCHIERKSPRSSSPHHEEFIILVLQRKLDEKRRVLS